MRVAPVCDGSGMWNITNPTTADLTFKWLAYNDQGEGTLTVPAGSERQFVTDASVTSVQVLISTGQGDKQLDAQSVASCDGSN